MNKLIPASFLVLAMICACYTETSGEDAHPSVPPEVTYETVETDVTESTETTEETVVNTTKPTEIIVEPTVEATEPTESTEATESVDLDNLGEFRLTAYCSCEQCCGYWATVRPLDKNGEPIVYTASGTIAQAGRTIAVDTTVIPHGTEVVINGHTYVAEDTGGAIKGNRIDIYFDSHDEAWDFGVQYAEVYIVRSE